MTATAIKHFDTLGYVESSKKLGVDEQVATYQARQIEQAIDIAICTAKTDVENKELATKHDIKKLETQIHQIEHKLEAQIHQAKFDIVVWVIGLLIVNGIFEHFFK